MMSIKRVLLLQKQVWHYIPFHCIQRQTTSLLIPAILWSPDSKDYIEIMETVRVAAL